MALRVTSSSASLALTLPIFNSKGGGGDGLTLASSGITTLLLPINLLNISAIHELLYTTDMARSTAKNNKAVSMKIYQRGAILFTLVSFILLISVAYLAVSKAQIRITPKPQLVTADFKFNIVESPTDSGDVSGFVFSKEVLLERSFTLPEDGATPVDDFAVGSVTLKNDSNRDQPLVASTRLLSPGGVLFRLDEGVTVPANGEVTALVTADQAGLSGNIGPSSFVIPGLREERQQEVYALSQSDMSGGIRFIRKITEEDLESVRQLARLDIIKEARTEWEALIDETIFDRSDFNFSSLEFEFGAELGDEIGLLPVIVRGNLEAIYYPSRALEEIGRIAIEESTIDNLEVLDVDYSKARINLESIDVANNRAIVEGEIDGKAVISESHPMLQPREFIGLSPEDVREKLNIPDLIESVEISFTPFWLKQMPRLADHIDIRIKKID